MTKGTLVVSCMVKVCKDNGIDLNLRKQTKEIRSRIKSQSLLLISSVCKENNVEWDEQDIKNYISDRITKDPMFNDGNRYVPGTSQTRSLDIKLNF